jgi:hypothetical protein
VNLCLGCFFEALTDRSSGNKVIHSGRPLAGRSRGTDIPVIIFLALRVRVWVILEGMHGCKPRQYRLCGV